MIVKCPSCNSVISIKKYGEVICPKCKSFVHVGDPVKDEKSFVIFINPSKEEKEKDNISDTEVKRPLFGKKDDKKRIGEGIPWDDAGSIGYTEAAFQTIVMLIKEPSRFFIRIKLFNPKGFIPLIGVFFAVIGAMFNAYWMLYFVKTFMPEISGIFPPEIVSQLSSQTGTEVAVNILFSPVMEIIYPGFIFYFISYFLGARQWVTKYYRIAAYLSILNFLYIVPVIGHIIVFFWKIILLYKAFRIVNMFSPAKAFITMMLYPAVLILIMSPLLFI